MEKIHIFTYSLILFIVISLALLASVFCILAEFNKSKAKDVKLDGRLCELPESEAFLFGTAALICLSIAQIIGNSIVFVGYCPDSKERRSCCQSKTPTIASILLVISWLNVGTSIILLSTATSMNKKQPYGKGWLGGECYIVKDGVFVGAAVLVLVSLGCNLASAVAALRKRYQVIAVEKAKRGALPSG